MDWDEPPFAVRWPQRILRRMGNEIQYTKWHWTKDGDHTLCGQIVALNREDCPTFPDIHEDAERVDCKKCKRKLSPAPDARK